MVSELKCFNVVSTHELSVGFSDFSQKVEEEISLKKMFFIYYIISSFPTCYAARTDILA